MIVNRNESFNKLINFIIKEIPWANKLKLNEQTDIVNDIGLYGDDCIELLEKFCKSFNIDCSNVDFSKCGQEGIDPIVGTLLWISSIFKRKGIKQNFGYKISDLIDLMENEVSQGSK